MKEAEQLGLNLPYHEKLYSEEREKKLILGYSDLLSKRASTITYSIEHLGGSSKIDNISAIQSENGSIGNSPAATAFVLTQGYDQWAYNYIQKVLRYNYDSSMGLYPFEIFERAWIMDNLVLADIPLKSQLKNIMIYLKENWTDDGISMSVTYPSKDLDDTAVVFKLLNKNNTKLNPSIFSQYFIEDHFKCYYTERNPSIIVQMRVMDAIKDLNNLENKEHYIEAVLDFLERNQFKDGYWKDKWNISPYNTTSNAIRALDDYDRKLTDKAVDWFLNTQNTDGSWGVLNGNSEETAYAVQALIYYHKNVEKIDIEGVEPGIKYLLENYANENYPELWIGKGLYAPRNIVKSAIISALYMYHSQIQPLKQLA
jgi:halimadienyl-diphosphate synthase